MRNKMRRSTLIAALVAVAGWATTSSAVRAHGGADGDHLNIGYYFGHDETFEAPANPPLPATLLVDTHPWELGEVFYPLAPTGGLISGWLGSLPGFEPLAPDAQEFDGHGFYSWLDPGFSLGAVHPVLHLDGIDAGLAILDPATLQPLAFPAVLGTGEFHLHAVYHLPISQNAQPGDVFTATFHLSDAAGTLLDSEPFTVQFQVVPEPASLGLVGLGAMLWSRRRFRR